MSWRRPLPPPAVPDGFFICWRANCRLPLAPLLSVVLFNTKYRYRARGVCACVDRPCRVVVSQRWTWCCDCVNWSWNSSSSHRPVQLHQSRSARPWRRISGKRTQPPPLWRPIRQQQSPSTVAIGQHHRDRMHPDRISARPSSTSSKASVRLVLTTIQKPIRWVNSIH